METRQLDFRKEKVQTLTLSELEATHHEDLPTGEPVGGIYHYVLLQQLLETFEQRGLKPVVQEIFAAQNGDSKRPGVTVLPQLEAKYGERALEAHLLRRVYANIELRADATDEVVTCLAVAYHQQGIQLGIGPMVRVCHNQTILGAQDVAANYGCYSLGGGHRMARDERTLSALMAKAEKWADYYGSDQMGRQEAIGRMKAVPFGRREMLVLVGRLTEARILHDTSIKELRQPSTYPLNSAQINVTTEKILQAFANGQDELNYWEAYQHFNFVLKPDRMDIPQVLPQSLALFELMKEVISD